MFENAEKLNVGYTLKTGFAYIHQDGFVDKYRTS